MTELMCLRKDCVANTEGICMALNRKVFVPGKDENDDGHYHSITEKWTRTCPFFLDKEMEQRDLALLKERLGIDGVRRK